MHREKEGGLYWDITIKGDTEVPTTRLECTMVYNIYRFTIRMYHILQNVIEVSIFFRLYGTQEWANDFYST
jgi:hypothetical protein